MPVELNCASSLIAVHEAVTGLRLGEVDMALAGGANAVLSAGITREMADLQLLSPEGRLQELRCRGGRLRAGARAAGWSS